MNQLAIQFEGMYAAQTAILGVAILATVGNRAVSQPAVLNFPSDEDNVVFSGTGQAGGFTMLMKSASFSSEPEEGDSVTCNGPANNFALVLTKRPVRSPTYTLTVGDPSFA